MPFPSILGGFESHQKQFFEIFEAKYNKRRKLWKNLCMNLCLARLCLFDTLYIDVCLDFAYL